MTEAVELQRALLRPGPLVLAALLVCGLASAGESTTAAPRSVDPRADKALREMSEFLASQKSFALTAASTVDVVVDGQKLKLQGEGKLQVQRPNKLRVDRAGELADASVYYDGKTLTVEGKRANVYATTPAPDSLDGMLDMAGDRLALYPPGADLLYSDAYSVLLSDVVSGNYVAQVEVDGTRAHHLAFRGKEVDWQIWIEDGPRPRPLKYVVTSKLLAMAPEYSVTLSDWKLSPRFSEEQFTFKNTEGAERVSFLAPAPEGKRQARKGGGKR